MLNENLDEKCLKAAQNLETQVKDLSNKIKNNS